MEGTNDGVIDSLISYLSNEQVAKTPGLFRRASNAASLRILRERIASGEDVGEADLRKDPHLAGALLKSCLQDLPEPILTFDLYEPFIELAKKGTYDPEFHENLVDLFTRIPHSNRGLLQRLMGLFHKLLENSQSNLLTAPQIALSFSRCFLRPRQEEEASPSRASVILKHLIEDGIPVEKRSSRSSVVMDGKSLRLISGVDSQQGKRKTMEDAHVALNHLNALFPKLPNDVKRAFYAVYDGHSGRRAADVAEQMLHKNIIGDPAFVREDTVVTAIQNGYKKTDELILELSSQETPRWKDGSTAATVLIVDRTMYFANLGDSEIVLGRWKNKDNPSLMGGIEATPLSHKHKPTNADEKSRIEALGGHVFQGRLFGTLAVARALGDSEMKVPISAANYVSAEPFVGKRELQTGIDAFLILACDGLWDKVTHQSAVEFVASCLSPPSASAANGGGGSPIVVGDNQQHKKDPKTIASLLVKKALDSGSTDNVTVVIVLFKWDNASYSSSSSPL
eukprot:TRINITY_DN16321_c0_g1_i1.p1 TRINITY_DN16321_c0_g1~~TRINITY_DN16321_c0_g1_i1.p1  ORF type:complete len:510 (-),score=106.49 TRINITY_DN16321_c0_g1_i1:90-1619(-)